MVNLYVPANAYTAAHLTCAVIALDDPRSDLRPAFGAVVAALSLWPPLLCSQRFVLWTVVRHLGTLRGCCNDVSCFGCRHGRPELLIAHNSITFGQDDLFNDICRVCVGVDADRQDFAAFRDCVCSYYFFHFSGSFRVLWSSVTFVFLIFQRQVTFRKF